MIVKQKSLGTYLNRVYETGDTTTKIHGKGKTTTLTPSEIYEIADAYHELGIQGFTTTINQTIASLYKDYGYIVEVEGIGWKIKRSWIGRNGKYET